VIELPDPAASPVVPEEVTVHEKVVPGILLVNATEVAVPEHIVAEEGVAVAFGFGSTVIATETGLPGQEFAVGVMLYVTVPEEAPVAVKICAIDVPLPDAPPETPVCDGIDQLNVAPATLLVSVMAVEFPEQIV
jgi:hypothetical protein